MNVLSTGLDGGEIALLVLLLIILIVAGIGWLMQQLGFSGLFIKAKTVGDGQHGNARWITEREKKEAYKEIEFDPASWRKGENLPPKELRGVIIAVKPPMGFQDRSDYDPTLRPNFKGYVETKDVHTGIYAGAGSGKTAFFLYPNLEYAAACGISFLVTDTKGDIYRNFGHIAQKYYNYNICVLDLRNPTASHGNNILAPVNKYMDMYLNSGGKDISSKAKAEKYANLISENIIGADSSNYGANSFFYDSAKGLLTATILLVSEFGEEGERHIPSVFTLLTQLLEQDVVIKNKMPTKELRYSKLIRKLPVEHRARLFAIAAITGSDATTMSVVTTALSKLNSFIDTELEQILCFENDVDIENFCKQKTALFIVLPEEDTTKYFMVSLLLQQFYRECLIYADSLGGKLKNRVHFYLDEIGTIPKIQGLDMMFSASRSRDVFLIPIMQAPSQMEEKYGKESAQTINSNIACMLYSGFSPESDLAKRVSDSLGTVTVKSASVSSSSDKPLSSSSTIQMTSKPLITPNELLELPQGTFIVRRTGQHPLKSRLYLFLRLGMTFPETYSLAYKELREVKYLLADELEKRVAEKYLSDNQSSEEPAPTSPQLGSLTRKIQRPAFEEEAIKEYYGEAAKPASEQKEANAQKETCQDTEQHKEDTKNMPDTKASGISLKSDFKKNLM